VRFPCLKAEKQGQKRLKPPRAARFAGRAKQTCPSKPSSRKIADFSEFGT